MSSVRTPSRALLSIAALLPPSEAFAQSFLPLLSAGAACNQQLRTGWLTAACIASFVGHVVVFIFQFVSVLFLISVIYAGYEIAIGSVTGDKSGGYARLRWSIIGVVVCVSVFLILDLFLNVLLGS